MFPILFSAGPVTFRTITLFLIMSIFVSSFIFWRKGKEEHYNILELFDGFILSSLVGLFFARVAYIVFNAGQFGFDIFKWFNFFKNPGFSLIVGIVTASLYLYKFINKKKWDSFEVLDFWVTSISIGLFVNHLGLFFEGVGYGHPTSLPWGVVFPQLIDPHHPVQIYTALFYIGLYFYLSKVEYRYRTFSWYRYGKKTAKTGFLTSMFLILVAIYNLFINFVRPPSFKFFGFNFDLIISFGVLTFGLILLYSRSGRALPVLFKKKEVSVRTKLEDLD